MRVLVCGSRDWDDRNIVTAVLTGLYAEETVGYLVTDMDGFTVIEGGARGADQLAAEWAHSSPFHSHNVNPDHPPFEHLQFHADWNAHGKAAGPIRNQQMLDEGKPDLVLAFKDNFDWTLRRGGTEDMVKRAKKAGVPVYVVSRV